MKPPAGRQFDLRPVDDGIPAESLKKGGGKVVLGVGLLLAGVGLAIGWSFGVVSVGRQNYNSANAAARLIDKELVEMQKTVGQISTAVAASNQRLAAERKPPLSFDPKLIEQFEGLKLDPRPSTAVIFRSDYARLKDLTVDQLMTYYFDAINLYAEVERFVRKTKADKASLESFAAKQGDKSAANYGVVFESQGKLALAKLVELGSPVCKGGGTDCTPDKVEKIEARIASGSPWSARKVGPKPDLDTVVPIDRTSPLFEAALSGSPEQARMEQYRQRLGNIMVTLQRLSAMQKPLTDSVKQAAAREDKFTF